jgi:serine/threonine protein phosphatase 1
MNDYVQILDLTEHSGRVFFTTDIHGYFDLLHEHLRDNAFDYDNDILIMGGDCCDRGPYSETVLDYLDNDWVYCIRGNHEELLIQAYYEDFVGDYSEVFLDNGGMWVAGKPVELIRSIVKNFESLPVGIELRLPTEVVGIVHAECYGNDWELFKNTLSPACIEQAIWEGTIYRYKQEKIVKGVDRLLVGHTPTDSGEIEQLGNIWYCDLGSFFRDKICFLQLK